MPTANDVILQELFSAAGAFHDQALKSIDPGMAGRLVAAETFIAIATNPAGARAVAQAEDGDLICWYQQNTLPPELATAAAHAIEAALASLSDRARVLLARRLHLGGRLGVLVARDATAVQIVIDADNDDLPHVVATLAPGGLEVTH